ncbi:MAG: archaemetzincin [Pyrinomonadaceae bacterium]
MPPATNSGSADAQIESLHSDIKKIEPFFKPLGIPERYDWLWDNKEGGQTFDEYIVSSPTLPTAERRIIYVQPIGKFTAQQSQVIQTTSDYLEAFFGLQVKTLPLKPAPGKLKEPDQRMIDYPKHRQLRSGYILETVLPATLPKDAAALIAFTDEDLYPDPTMNYVFGQASLENRVGVWSLFRLDDQATFETFLRRTMKIAAHETGHMFSMRHCTKYECVMSGSNHLGETDRRPIDACPECMAKIAWMNKEKPLDRYKRLAAFARKYRLTDEAADFKTKETAVN